MTRMCDEVTLIRIMKTPPCNVLQFFTAVKNDNFQLNFFDFYIFAQNKDCGYILEPPQ